MNYVKHFNVLGVDAAQIPCIELQGIPTTATEGAVGLLGMNVLSVDHEVYICTEVKGTCYTWIPLKGDGGISITKAEVNTAGELVITLSNGNTLNAGVVAGSGCFVNGQAADIHFDSDPQIQINERVKKSGDTISGVLSVDGQLVLPNSPTTPDEASVVDSYVVRETANKPVTGLTVVDGSETLVDKIEGDTVASGNELKHAYFKAIKSTGRNLFNPNTIKVGIGHTDSAIKTRATSGLMYVENMSYYTLKIKKFPKQANSYRIGLYESNKVSSVLGATNSFTSDTYTFRPFSITHKANYVSIVFACPDGSEFVQSDFDDIEVYLVKGETIENEEPYTESLFELPETLELPAFVSLNPQTGELTNANHRIVLTGNEKWTGSGTRQTGKYSWALQQKHNTQLPTGVKDCGIASGGYDTITSIYLYENNKGISFESGLFYIYDPEHDGSMDDWINHLKALNQAGTPIVVEIKVETPTVTKLENIPKSYTVYEGGTESIIYGSEDNSVYAAIPTITQTYSIHENPTEAANKAYVNNGLAKKLDKTGGTITGNLIVEGKTDTELGAIISKQNNVTYGLAYDNETYKLGQGTVDEKGDFTFNEGEGLPIALRDDSSSFKDGHLVKWSTQGNKFVDSNVVSSDVDCRKLLWEGSVDIGRDRMEMLNDETDKIFTADVSLLDKYLEIEVLYQNTMSQRYKVKFSEISQHVAVDSVCDMDEDEEGNIYLINGATRFSIQTGGHFYGISYLNRISISNGTFEYETIERECKVVKVWEIVEIN